VWTAYVGRDTTPAYDAEVVASPPDPLDMPQRLAAGVQATVRPEAPSTSTTSVVIGVALSLVLAAVLLVFIG
jgi:hypothetical protein